jgi:SAM-dependent methyltransferase
VWNTCLLFFQFVLLLGYLYAHLSFKWAGTKRQPWLHGVVLLLPLFVLPITMPQALKGVYQHALGTNPDSLLAQPAFMVLAMLFASVGLPFFALAGGAPVVQRWFSRTDDPRAHDPYFLYQASNLGSMLALLSYPLFFERAFGLVDQSRWWSVGYIVLVVLIAAGLWVSRRHWHTAANEPAEPAIESPYPRPGHENRPPPSWRDRGIWVALSAGPSALLLAITAYLTTNLAPIPLLWVVPLALYLLTFIIAFATNPIVPAKAVRFLAFLAVLPAVVTLHVVGALPLKLMMPVHIGAFFLVALMCHMEIGASRPRADHLTEFYLWISVGGVIGGFFSSIVAPLAFNSLAEYPIALVFCYFAVGLALKPKRSLVLDLAMPIAVGLLAAFLEHRYADTKNEYAWAYPVAFGLAITTIRPVAFAAALAAAFIGLRAGADNYGHLLDERSFFGVHYVEAVPLILDHKYTGTYQNRLMNGTTYHGGEFMDDRKDEPITYYNPRSGVGRAVKALAERHELNDFAVVGLGTGTMAAYGQPGGTVDYYEIDPSIERMARNPKYFTYVTDCKAKVRVLLGDARLRIQEAKPAQYDLIALDAFASDAIPVHLLTVEAFHIYKRVLKPDGILAVHVSNRYLNLPPVVEAGISGLGWKAWDCDDIFTDSEKQEREDAGENSSDWVLVGTPAALAKLGKDKELVPLQHDPKERPWTDDYSNVLSAMFAFQRDSQ